MNDFKQESGIIRFALKISAQIDFVGFGVGFGGSVRGGCYRLGKI